LSVKIEVPYHLLQFVNSNEIVEVEGTTVKECLLSLTVKYPAMLPELFDINGEMAVIVLHGGEPVSDATINRPGEGWDTIGLFPIIVGG
jgi:hypothetical protein